MLFHSFKFIAFLIVVFSLYWGVLRTHKSRKVFLVLSSYVFYMSWNPKLILLLWASTTVDYLAVLGMGRTDRADLRRLFLSISVFVNLGLLALFKYANFFIENISSLASRLDIPLSAAHLDIVLPLGISFYTFETISYTIDAYYRKTKPCKSALDYSLFISFFPHLIAGPIVRPKQFLPQVENPRELTRDDISIGLGYFLYGLLKKMVIADRLSVFADAVFSAPGDYAGLGAWLGVIAYALQIYCDFSGYSNMAIGLARLFAFELPVNFRTPYLSLDVSEFWRRWHMTLSTWLRDYLYAPLRGASKTEWSVQRALFLTMALGGLWHGANWTFVAWGVYHGLLLMIHRAWSGTLKLPAALSRLAVFALVCVGWVFFRAPNMTSAFHLLAQMAHINAASLHMPGWDILSLIGVVAFLDAVEFRSEARGYDLAARWAAWPASRRAFAYAFALASLILLAPSHVKPFIYFQF